MDRERDIITRINEKFPHMSKGHKAIAAFILEHYDQAAFMTAARLGRQLHVSESTVVRFASGIGYSGYPEMQAELAARVTSRLNAVERVGVKYAGRSQSEVIESVLASDMENIRATTESLDAAAFDTAVDILLEAKTVYVIGIRSCAPLAEFLSFYLNMVRGGIVLLKTTSLSEVFEQMLRVGREDVVIGIGFPRYSMRTLKALEFANDRNAKVITITDSVHSPMCLYSSCNLFAASDMVSIVDSLVAPLSVINALVVALCLKQPQTVRESLESLEGVWNNYQVSMHDEIDRIDEDSLFTLPGAGGLRREASDEERILYTERDGQT
ncbi:MAG TPA: MurR/RpiR family transcriptional regulator [Candidatus Eisenbergiella intestinigallinarum]|uniref:MurR/RpiR family transcriptional regulator n=1 Tax=Candidatus Eisenbergiella intestinigallinarum TaxID=2838549 RepID=A0A9D2QI48_9FIRM|nr:MurR/RpiR family transcriptional regulator [Candidatus Eisenbergiella intestinigallinarum]